MVLKSSDPCLRIILERRAAVQYPTDRCRVAARAAPRPWPLLSEVRSRRCCLLRTIRQALLDIQTQNKLCSNHSQSGRDVKLNHHVSAVCASICCIARRVRATEEKSSFFAGHLYIKSLTHKHPLSRSRLLSASLGERLLQDGGSLKNQSVPKPGPPE